MSPRLRVALANDSIVAAGPSTLGRLAIALQGASKIPTFDVQPPERIEIARRKVFVADFLGQGQAFLEHGQRGVVVALASERKATHKEPFQERA